MSETDERLFSGRDLREVMETVKVNMAREIGSSPAEHLLNTPTDDLATYFEAKYTMAPIRILEDAITADQKEITIDVSRDPLRYISDPSKPFLISGTAIVLHVPFEGEGELFRCRPSTYTSNPPRGVVHDDHVELIYKTVEHDQDRAKQELASLLDRVKAYVGFVAKDVAPLNSSLKTIAGELIEQRKQKLLKDKGLVASLGFPLRARPNSSPTYISPQVRRKVLPRPPEPSTTPYVPEPALEVAEYENVIQIIKTTASVLERSPRAFRDMDEEALRNQFLVPLNSHYEGQATGETFNFGGKTDILVRDGDRSVFVAECKIWRGPKSLTDAIDQLLGYATWRDGKAAVLLFNRNKDISSVLSQIPDVTASHPYFKRLASAGGPNDFRVVVTQPADMAREISLAVLVFDIPR